MTQPQAAVCLAGKAGVRLTTDGQVTTQAKQVLWHKPQAGVCLTGKAGVRLTTDDSTLAAVFRYRVM